MTTIRDVAREAGVSVGTVSNVLNNMPSVSEKKQRQVKAAIEKLGYRRNILASQLRSNVSRTIGLIVPDITNPFYSEIARGVDDEARKRNYTVFLCNKDRSEKVERELINTLSAKCVDGIILLKPHIDGDLIRQIREERSLLLFDGYDGEEQGEMITVDDARGVQDVASRLVSLGHRQIGLIYAYDGSLSSLIRRRAFLEETKRLGVSIPDTYCLEGHFTVEGGMEAFRLLMEETKRPTAVFCTNDRMAIGALHQAREMSLDVPGDVSIIGYDDIPEARWTTPPLTTVSHPKYELGTICARQLFARIANRQGTECVNCDWSAKELIPVFTDRGSLSVCRTR